MHGLTFTAWINLETSKKSQALLSLANEKSANAFLLMFGDQDGREGPLRLWSIGINGDSIDAEVIARVPPNTLVNRWSHITVAHNNLESTIKVYVDGNLDQEVNCKINRLVVLQNGAFIGQDQDHVGGGFNSNQAFKGSIDDVRIYNRALSDDEVKALYDLEKPKGK
jgi:hypothetical protein